MAEGITSKAEKKRAACDECRTRKLKCSGDQPKCSRCEREDIACVYSPQKQMGRPRKRRRDDEVANGEHVHDHYNGPTITMADMRSDPMAFMAPGLTDTDFGPMNFPAPAVAPPYAGGPPSLGQDSFMPFPLDPALGALSSSASHSSASNGSTDHSSILSPQSLSHLVADAPRPTCACLSGMYLALSNLQGLQDYTFPFALQPMRQAMGTVDQVLDCPDCHKDSTGAFLNVSIVTSLLFSTAERFRKVVEEINSEAARVEAAGGKKTFKLGDANGENVHLHTATPDCPARFDLELDAGEWRIMAIKVVKREVYGSSEESGGHGLVGLIGRLEERQLKWHADPEKMKMQERLFGESTLCHARKTGDWNCVRQARNIRMVIDRIPW